MGLWSPDASGTSAAAYLLEAEPSEGEPARLLHGPFRLGSAHRKSGVGRGPPLELMTIAGAVFRDASHLPIMAKRRHA